MTKIRNVSYLMQHFSYIKLLLSS